MGDLIKRLRKIYGAIDKFEIANEAADRIEELEAQLTSVKKDIKFYKIMCKKFETTVFGQQELVTKAETQLDSIRAAFNTQCYGHGTSCSCELCSLKTVILEKQDE